MDYLSDRHAAVARFNGGSNAGHTVVIGAKRSTFHLIPSGALKGKELLVGAGVALDPMVLREELGSLPGEARGRLLVDGRCGLVSPLDRELDGAIEDMRGESAIGTTRRGVGPSYAMRALRLAPRVSDLLAGFDYGALSRFYGKLGIETNGLDAWARSSAELLRGVVGDVGARVMKLNEAGKTVLFEASQGTLLDILHGSYPYVTATHTVVSYLPSAVGVPPSSAGEPLGVMKCYTTRVGEGPFPTELSGDAANEMRAIGNEYGATTGRPRRVGWLDLVALRYAIKLNEVKKVAVSKLDVLSKVGEFKACVAYRRMGSETEDFQSSLPALSEVEPVLESPFTMEGADFRGGSLPPQAKRLVEYLEDSLRVKVSLVSYGDERSMTLELN